MKNKLEKHRKVLGFIGGVLAFVVAVIYFKITPEEASSVDGLQKTILLYGHSTCWSLLGGASLLWGTANKWSVILAYAALATYAAFMGALLIAQSA